MTNNDFASKQCCIKVIKFLFSNIGISAIVILYIVAGGFIFEHLEKTNELEECNKARDKYLPAENDTVYKLWDIAASFRNDDDMKYALEEYQKIVEKFRSNVLDLGYDGKNCSAMNEPDGPGYQWNFAGALLFSVTVVTTIGYGNIAPKTFWGRLVCIAYATLGIPLMLLCLANLGNMLAGVFRFIYTNMCCCGCCRSKSRHQNEADASLGSSVISRHNRISNLSPEETSEKTRAARKKAFDATRNNEYTDEEYHNDMLDNIEEDKISVPLTITMTVIGGYIFAGALLFGVWENWDPLKASYFCFVTISTIGFGDVVPGSANLQTSEDQWKMIGAAIYMIFGMAILSMCFSLIQEEIEAKFAWIGNKMGLSSETESDEIEDNNESVFATKNDDDYTNTSPPVYAEKALPSSQTIKPGNPRQSTTAGTSSATRHSVNGSRDSMTSSSLGTIGRPNSSRGQRADQISPVE